MMKKETRPSQTLLFKSNPLPSSGIEDISKESGLSVSFCDKDLGINRLQELTHE